MRRSAWLGRPTRYFGKLSSVAGFTIAYFTEDDLLSVHVWAGYVVGALVVARVLWGFVAPGHARFSDFLYDPATTFRYVRDLILLRGRRYLGHVLAAATWSWHFWY